MNNYFLKQIWRNILKNKSFSFLNSVGLALGFTCFTFIFLWVLDEKSYDKFNSHYHRIVRLTETTSLETGIARSAFTSAPMANALKGDYPEVENAVRLESREEIVTHNGQQVLQSGILLTDPSFFDIFSYQINQGNIKTALNDPFSIILTVSTAKKYFGDDNPMGKTLMINMYDITGKGVEYKITGIMPDPPQNAHFTFNILASFKTIEDTNPGILSINGWGQSRFYTYLLLKEGIDYNLFSHKISQFYEKYVGKLFNDWRSIYTYQLQPLSDIHLRSDLENEIETTGDIKKVYLFITIGILILFLASINYTNLATAQAVHRAKEVGIKKVVGANKSQLALQFLAESIFTTCLALFISFLFSFLLQPFFQQITGKNLTLISSPLLFFILLGVTLILGLLSGIYPAIVISSFKPIIVLKGPFKSARQGVMLRKTLVVTQFVIAIILITGIFVITYQMSFMKNKNLGYDKDGLIFLRVNGNTDVINGFSSFKNELINNTMIDGVTVSNSLIFSGLGTSSAETVDLKNNPVEVNTSSLRVDTNYFKVYGIKLLVGNNFTTTPLSDSSRQVILNESAVKYFGWKSNEFAIGKPFKIGNQKGTVVGVSNDFHYNSLQHSIQPLAICPIDTRFSRITLKIKSKNIGKVIPLVERVWKNHFHSALFDYGFLNQQIINQYIKEDRFYKIFLCFAILSLLIACLGLYGLIAHNVFQKTKEIGVRKVLGASTVKIGVQLSLEILKLIIAACIFSAPISRVVMNMWLQDFAYRINLSWWMFVSASLLVVMISLIIISHQTIRAAFINPVKSLRTE